MSKLKLSIDYKRLELELQEALEADELYKLQNDAKLRAVEQKVPTYEHFRQMVNGAHLKPLKRGDITPKVGVFWNPVTTKKSNRSHSTRATKIENSCKETAVDTAEITDPTTCEEFIKTWKKFEDWEEKFSYLKSTRDRLQTIFRVEIPSTLFGEFVDVCSKNLTGTRDVKSITEILTGLSRCGRFRVTVCLMTQSEREMCRRIFRELLIVEKCQDSRLARDIGKLSTAYGVSFE